MKIAFEEVLLKFSALSFPECHSRLDGRTAAEGILGLEEWIGEEKEKNKQNPQKKQIEKRSRRRPKEGGLPRRRKADPSTAPKVTIPSPEPTFGGRSDAMTDCVKVGAKGSNAENLGASRRGKLGAGENGERGV